MSYTVTYNPGTDYERSEVVDSLMDVETILYDFEDDVPDGYAILIRKTNYMEYKRPRQDIKAGGNVYAAGRNLTVIQGGRK